MTGTGTPTGSMVMVSMVETVFMHMIVVIVVIVIVGVAVKEGRFPDKYQAENNDDPSRCDADKVHDTLRQGHGDYSKREADDQTRQDRADKESRSQRESSFSRTMSDNKGSDDQPGMAARVNSVYKSEKQAALYCQQKY